ncbi:MAG: DNA recombination protein RmuC [Clostridiales Family XIII bacterium]|jgi:DNA recombination protein RmuC|nr:DNA recombination protein RmuC [Clostridiales Family XIII bacterium]
MTTTIIFSNFLAAAQTEAAPLTAGLPTLLMALGFIVPAAAVIAAIALMARAFRKTHSHLNESRDAVMASLDANAAALRDEQLRIAAEQREETARAAAVMREGLERSTAGLREELGSATAGLREEIRRTLAEQAMQNEQKLDNIRKTMEERIGAMQEGNERQLNRMRETVDEKLQETLNKRISESFRSVQEQLGKVSEGLGEMQSLAADVGGLKNVLSNVKTKGILGEYQLAAILEQMLSREQYAENIATKSGSADRVEFAVKLPGESGGGGAAVYLPIDAKFPSTLYEQLMAAYESGEAARVDEARKALAQSAKQSARTIHDKYIDPPQTTDFAIMFLPTEGLYAEVVNMGLIEELQRLYKVNIAGPTTMAALLNSLQMGFKTLAIQKRSSEVWNVLGSVKTEFEKFGGVLEKARTKLAQADSELDTLIGTRTNAINRKLRGVEAVSEPGEQAESLPLVAMAEEASKDTL